MTIPWMDDLVLGWRDVLDILLVTLLIYKAIIMLRGTRVVPALHGLFLVVLFYFLTRPIGLNTITWILENFLGSLFLIIIIVFQRDIRLALTYMGSRGRFSFKFLRRKQNIPELVEPIANAVTYMAQRRIGAIVVIERSMPLADVVTGGVKLDARISKELLISIFWVGGPLHDGAVLLRDGKISEAGCILPLTTLVEGKQDYGTRHRASIGVTEETDAVAVVVSEERGAVSIATRGRLTAPLDGAQLRRALIDILEKRS